MKQFGNEALCCEVEQAVAIFGVVIEQVIDARKLGLAAHHLTALSLMQHDNAISIIGFHDPLSNDMTEVASELWLQYLGSSSGLVSPF